MLSLHVLGTNFFFRFMCIISFQVSANYHGNYVQCSVLYGVTNYLHAYSDAEYTNYSSIFPQRLTTIRDQFYLSISHIVLGTLFHHFLIGLLVCTTVLKTRQLQFIHSLLLYHLSAYSSLTFIQAYSLGHFLMFSESNSAVILMNLSYQTNFCS